MGTQERLHASLEQLERWMRANGALALVENLAPGASDAELAEVERALGFPLTTSLRALWRGHGGQRSEGNGFITSYDLFRPKQALDERRSVLLNLEYLRGERAYARTGGLTDAELDTDAWVPFAGRDADLLAVCAESGRVFFSGDAAPPIVLRALSLATWFEAYAAAVSKGEFVVEQGFGGVYLAEDDGSRAAEARIESEARQRKQRRKTEPVATLVKETVDANRPDRCLDLVEGLLADRGPSVMREVTAALWALKPAPSFLAEALRPFLSQLELTPGQWSTVAEGAVVIENAAVRDFALRKARGG